MMGSETWYGSVESAWSSPAEMLSLPTGEVHVWVADLAQPTSVLATLKRSLAQDELTRASKFAFPHLRSEFVAARGILRDILSRYTGVQPEMLTFSYGAFGKPRLAESSFGFNLAHSLGVAVYAVACDREVGVDIECGHHLPADLEQFVSQTFSVAECVEFLELPSQLRRRGFLNCWTRKEAFIKAKGDGLSFPLDRFDVSLRPCEPPLLVRVLDKPEEPSRWRYESFQYSSDYVIAVIAEGRDWTAKQYRWESPDTIL